MSEWTTKYFSQISYKCGARNEVASYIASNALNYAHSYLWSQSLFKCLCLCRCSILICATDVKCVVVAQSAISCKDIGTQNTTNDITKMRNIVDVWQGTGYEYIAFTLDG